MLMHGGGQTRHAWEGQVQPSHTLATEPCRSTFEATAIATGRPMVITRCSVTQMISSRLQQPAQPPALVGASLGGLASMLALATIARSGRTPLASCLVLVDVAPRIETAGRFKIQEFMRSACVVSTVLMKQPMPLRSTTPSSTSKRFVGVEKEPSSTRRRALVLALGPTIRQRAK